MDYKIDMDAAAFVDVREQMKDLITTETDGQADPYIRKRTAPADEEASRLDRPAAGAETYAVETERDMIKLLSEQQGLPYVNLGDYKLGDHNLLRLIPSTVAQNYKCLPLELKPDGALVVAISDPLNVHIPDDLRLYTGRNIVPVVANEGDIMARHPIHLLYLGAGESRRRAARQARRRGRWARRRGRFGAPRVGGWEAREARRA